MSATLDPTSEDPQPILGACRAHDSLASEKYPSEKTIGQLEGVGEVDVKNANYILYLSGKCKIFAERIVSSYSPFWSDFQLQYATKRPNLPSLDSVRLVIFRSADEEEKVLSPEKDSPDTWTWTQTLPIEL